ncbi:hypothetical protein SAMN05443247_07860 [Bradyrhizobium erythrophlei]|jgi:hypothetical protein|nr:hypothetical protein SAMN05443247_07860 [Bradyrhizobium erythrophlei]
MSPGPSCGSPRLARNCLRRIPTDVQPLQHHRVVNRYVGNLPPMPGVFPDYPAPVVRNIDTGSELTTMRWGMPPPPKFGGPPASVDSRQRQAQAKAFAGARLNSGTRCFYVRGFGSVPVRKTPQVASWTGPQNQPQARTMGVAKEKETVVIATRRGPPSVWAPPLGRSSRSRFRPRTVRRSTMRVPKPKRVSEENEGRAESAY